MRRLIFIFLCLISFLISFTFYSSASNYTAYASVTSSTSNISMLIETMYNQSDFNSFQDWIGIRTGQYDYSVFYNIVDGNAKRIRYYGINSGYATDWSLSFSSESNFSYTTNGYTIVGSVSDSLGSSSFRDYHSNFISSVCVTGIFVVLLFFVFRIRKAKRSISI